MHLPWGRAPRGANICPRAHIWERRNAFSFSTGNSPKSQVAPTAEPWTCVPRPLSAPGLPATELISLTAVGPLRSLLCPTCHHQTRRDSGQRAEVDGKGSSQRGGCCSPLTAHPGPQGAGARDPVVPASCRPLSAWHHQPFLFNGQERSQRQALWARAGLCLPISPWRRGGLAARPARTGPGVFLLPNAG